MGPLSLGLELASFSSTGGDVGTGFLLWQGTSDYLTINAAGDKFYINI